MRIGSMVCVAAALAIAGSVQAAVVNYTGLNQTYNYPQAPAVQMTNSTGAVALDATSGVFTNPGGGAVVPSATRYYGGVFHYTPTSTVPNTSAWGGSATFTLATSADTTKLVFGKPGGVANWVLNGRTNFDSGIFATGDMPFVIKVSNYANGWNIVHASLFLGNSATAATEGTPLATIELVSNNPLTTATFAASAETWAASPSQASLSGAFSSTSWNPVVVPEPAAITLLAIAGLGLVRRRTA